MILTKQMQIIFSIAAAAGLWVFLIFVGSMLPAESGMHRFVEVLGGTSSGIIQALIYAVFFYSYFQLAEKRRRIRQQYAGFEHNFLPTQDQLVLTPEEVADIKLKVIQFERNGQATLVGDFIKKAATQYRNDQSIGETLQVFNTQVDNNKEEAESDLEIVRYLLSAIFSLGFIGTLLGLSSAIGLSHLAKTVEGMPQITRSLYLAFDTTLVALLVGLILNFVYHRYLQEMDAFYSRAKSYVIDNLISRIYKPAYHEVE